LITDDEAVSLKEGTRVFYTKKDGTRIYGQVRSLYLDKRMLSMKPDKQSDDDPAYNQSYRFRRLTVDNKESKTEFFGNQIAPLVIMAAAKSTPKSTKRVYSCKDGLFVVDGRKLFLEKIKGLKDGYVKDDELAEMSRREIEEQKKFDDSIIRVTRNKQIAGYEMFVEQFKSAKPVTRISVDAKEFSRSVKAIPYSTGKYYAKWSDVAKMNVDGGVQITVYNKNDELCSVNKLEGVLGTKGSAKTTSMLYDMRELVKGIRTKEYEIRIYSSGTIVVETDAQLRIIFPLKKTTVANKATVVSKKEKTAKRSKGA